MPDVFIVYTADHDYFGLAYGEADRDNQLELVAITTHRPGYAEPYESAVRDDLRGVNREKREREIWDRLRVTMLEAARRRGDTKMIAILERKPKGLSDAA